MFVSDLSIPAFAFVEASDHDRANFRAGRNLMLHTQTLTLMEVLELDNILIMELPDGAKYLDFNFFTKEGLKEEYRIVVQATLLDDNNDALRQAAVWFSEYLKWYEDNVTG